MMLPRFQTHLLVLTPTGRLDLDRLEADSDRQVQQEQQHLRLHPDYQSRRPRRQPHRGQQVPSGVELAYHGKRPTNKQYINCLIHRLNFRIYSLEQMQ